MKLQTSWRTGRRADYAKADGDVPLKTLSAFAIKDNIVPTRLQE
ncbi:hypothetical protein [Streptomyces sp. TLI_146]|nr:hypothetical protein [Streptomyces sp. TLI_146]